MFRSIVTDCRKVGCIFPISGVLLLLICLVWIIPPFTEDVYFHEANAENRLQVTLVRSYNFIRLDVDVFADLLDPVTGHRRRYYVYTVDLWSDAPESFNTVEWLNSSLRISPGIQHTHPVQLDLREFFAAP